MPGVRYKWEGKPALGKVMKTVREEVLRKAARDVRKSAYDAAPVDTGRLRRGIKVIADPVKLNFVVFCSVPYASYQEEGTRYMEGKWFMKRAIESVVSTFTVTVRA